MRDNPAGVGSLVENVCNVTRYPIYMPAPAV